MSAVETILLVGGTFLLTYGVILLISDATRRPVRCLFGRHAWRWSSTGFGVQVCRYCPRDRRRIN